MEMLGGGSEAPSFHEIVIGKGKELESSFFTKSTTYNAFKKPTVNHPGEGRVGKTSEKQFNSQPESSNGKAQTLPQVVNPCKPKSKKIPTLEIMGPDIVAYRNYMQEHAMIYKLMGLWPTEKTLNKWIQMKWRSKGDIMLQLVSKWFFTVIFDLMEDRDHSFEGGPYFFNLVSLYMHYSKENFTPKKEDLTSVLVWVILYSFPTDYWSPSVLKGIGDEIVKYIKMSEGTRTRHYVSYARICVYLDVSSALSEVVNLMFRDEVWL